MTTERSSLFVAPTPLCGTNQPFAMRTPKTNHKMPLTMAKALSHVSPPRMAEPNATSAITTPSSSAHVFWPELNCGPPPILDRQPNRWRRAQAERSQCLVADPQETLSEVSHTTRLSQAEKDDANPETTAARCASAANDHGGDQEKGADYGENWIRPHVVQLATRMVAHPISPPGVESR